MRILYFTRDYTTHDHRFLSALAKTEHDVFYLRLEQRGHPLEDRPLPEGITQMTWSGGRAPATILDGPRLLIDLKRLIHRIKPDLIQAGPLQRSALLVALTGYQPLLSMSWGYDLILEAQQNAWWRWATRFTLQRSTMMIGDCETIRDLAISFGMPNEAIVTFPWGIDLEHFSPPTDGKMIPDEDQPQTGATEMQPFTLLSTRAWEPIYGVDLIARAFVRAAKQTPNLQLVMLGNGSLSTQIKQIFSQGGVLGDDPNIQARVVFPGQVGYRDLPRFHRSADLYLAATHSDGTSISLLEAMACGTPVLVSDIPGNREWVNHETNGWLFANGNIEALTKAILEAVEKRPQLPEMGQAARRIAEQRADWRKNFPVLLSAYQTITKRNSYSSSQYH